ncbi:BID domain-containing T4SS effector [Bartonella krasnovii]|uniref:BID domain-containing T4SS effector n=1 Tax=Bartonella krasnovii TaxID=2267275 RepID=UPI001F4D2062|nr:BID domain-containing T4SS effector [Bartonella krasnovii]UNF51686.1 BID domain-containing T4SS effector [Bartonella krasnovii]
MKENTEQRASSTQEELQEQSPAVNAAVLKQINEASQNFFYPNSKVLKNKYRIKDKEILKERCSDDVKKEMIKLRQEPPPEQFDATYLKYLHHRLFFRAFEWAGQTREAPFTFEDSTVASMPILKRKEFTKPFAMGKKIQEGLEKLDKTLAEKKNLQGLSREEFVEHAAEIMIDLHHLHPFREGNRRTKRLFVEKLAQAAGHTLDFSIVSKKRKDFVRTAAMERGDSEPMKHLLEDISHPEKLLILQEFTNSMRKLGMGEKNYYLTVVAKEGETYHGTYRGCGANGFMMDVQGTLILGNKKDLTPEQRQTLTSGETFSFTAPKAQSPEKKQQKTQQKTLLPEEKRAALKGDEITEKSKDNASIQTKRKEKAHFSPWVVPHALQDSAKVIPQNLQEKEQRAQPMVHSASSMRQTQKDFQETILQTSHIATNDQISVQMTTGSDHQERAKQYPQKAKAMAYWESGIKTTDTALLKKLSLSPKLKEKPTPEPIQTLKTEDTASFTTPSAQHQQEVLIAAKKIPPLTSNEITTRIKNNTSLQARRTEIETLCQIIYGNRHILQEKIERIHENHKRGEQLTHQIATSPQSISQLSGSNILGIKNHARTEAEANILPLCRAIECYLDILKQTERDILHNHHAKQKRCKQSVLMPKVWMQNLLSLPKEKQKETLSNSPELRGEIRTYMKKINERLSLSEHEAIKENNPEKLAKSLGTSAVKAKEILEIVKQTKEIEQNIRSMDFYDRQFNERSVPNQHQSLPHQWLKKNTEKTWSPPLDKEASKTQKMIENVHQNIKRQENIPSHKTQHTKAMTL